MPADPEEIAEAEREGITILYRRGPRRFVGDGRVQGLETIVVESVFDPDGRFSPTFLPGTEEVLPADSVILAVGQAADLSLLGAVTLEQTPQGTVRVDPITLQTSHPKIWAGGDVAKGPRNLIDAVADGQRAAAAIHAALGGARSGVAARDRAQCPSGLSPSRQRLRRDPSRGGAHHADRSSHRIRRGGGGLRRSRCHARVASLPALLRQHHARPRALHPVWSLRRHLSHRLHHDRAGRPHRRRCRDAVRTAARRRPVHPLCPVRQPLSARRVVHGVRGEIVRA